MAVTFYANGEDRHDSMTHSGDFVSCVHRAQAGETVEIAVTRYNIFWLDKLISFVGLLKGTNFDLLPICPSPLSDLPIRFHDSLNIIRRIAGTKGIIIRIVDDQLNQLLTLAAEAAQTAPEPSVLRILGACCQTPLVGPEWVVFETINSCNMNCYYCNIHSPSRSPSHQFLTSRMQFEDYKRIVEELPGMGTTGVTLLANGEPLLHPDIDEMARFAKSKNLMVNIFTNGLLLNPHRSQLWKDLHVDELFITVSAASEEIYLKLHANAVHGDFKKVMQNIELLSHAKGSNELPRIYTVHVICHENAHELIQMAQDTLHAGCTGIRPQLIRLDQYNRHLALTPNDLAQLDRDLPKLILFCEENNLELFPAFHHQVHHAISGNSANWSGDDFLHDGCLIGYTLAIVKENLDLSFCCTVKPIANLKESSFNSIWWSPSYSDLRNAALDLPSLGLIRLADGNPLYTDACHHCDNHDTNRRMHDLSKTLGFDRFLRERYKP